MYVLLAILVWFTDIQAFAIRLFKVEVLIISFLLIASAILISSWILLWRHLRPNRVSTCVRIILQNNLCQES